MRITRSISFLIFLFCLVLKPDAKSQIIASSEGTSYTRALAQLGITNVDTDYSTTKTLLLVKVWDSLNRNHHNVIYDKLPAKEWQ
ncbi:MAG: hypothetical protein KA534_05085, partial [Sediminibacterium sp.]|nr:hypothetical protein [Sediminibacterium sp.]